MSNAQDHVVQGEEESTQARRRTDLVIGNSLALERVLEMIAVAAWSDIGVIIQGRAGPARSWWRVPFTTQERVALVPSSP